MAKIELELNEATIERLKALAQDRRASVESIIEDQFAPQTADVKPDRLLGLFVDEPEVVDEIMNHVRAMRKETGFRSARG